MFTRSRGGDRQSTVGIFIELVAQRADRYAENVGGVGTVAQAVLEGFQDQIAFDVGDCAADQRTRNLFGGEGGVRYRRRGLGEVEAVAIGRQDRVRTDFVALRHQHRTVHGIL